MNFDGRTVVTTPYEGYRRMETTFNGKFRNSGVFNLNSNTKMNSGESVVQSFVYQMLEGQFNLGYSLKGPGSKELDFGISGIRSEAAKKLAYEIVYNYDGDQYLFNVSRDASQPTKVTRFVLQTPYDNMKNVRLTQRSAELSPFDLDLSAEWNTDRQVRVVMRETIGANGHYRLSGDLSGPWFEPTTMDLSLAAPNGKLFEFNIVKSGKNILHSTVGRKSSSSRSIIVFVLKVNQRKIVDLKIDSTMSELGYSATVTSSGAHSKMTLTTELKFIENGYHPQFRMCIDSMNQCLDAGAKVLIKKLEGRNFDIEVDVKVQTNPHHIMQTTFEITSESGFYSSKMMMYLNKMENRYLGYDFIFDAPKGNLKVELVSSTRKVVLRYDVAESGSTTTWTVKLSGQEQGHDLIAFVQKTEHSSNHRTYRLQVSHPALHKVSIALAPPPSNVI